jgi:hypothetical protein
MAKKPPEGAATPVGNYLYVFRTPLGSTECLISAHGGYKKSTKTFNLKAGLTVNFYGEHHKVLKDPGLSLMQKKPQIVNSHPDPGGEAVLDYILSKYQGTHSSANETYDEIASKLAHDAVQMKEYRNYMDYVNKNPAIKAIFDALKAVHVITIRNRFMHANVNLSTVIEEVTKFDSSIKTFHCSFCRSLIGDAKPETSSVQFGS